MRFDAVVFDFDGTIADTVMLTFDAMNVMQPEFGYEPIRKDEIPLLETMSARELLTKRLKIPLWQFWKIYRLERRGREILCAKADTIRVFPGMREALRQLHDAGIKIGILSSNSESVIRQVIERSGISVDFFDAGSRVFGKARALRKLRRRHSFDTRRVLYVGDELRDIEACRAVGVPMLAVAWGYNDAKVLADSGTRVILKPEELFDAIQSL